MEFKKDLDKMGDKTKEAGQDAKEKVDETWEEIKH
jgi:hypothetical protein